MHQTIWHRTFEGTGPADALLPEGSSRDHRSRSRIRQLEDRAEISEQVIKYAMGVDRRDWAMFASCFTNPVFSGFSGGGIPAATISRADLVALVSPH